MNEKFPSKRPRLFLFGIALAFGLIISTLILSGTIEKVKLANRRIIRVKGYAERKITSDWAMWEGSFTVRQPDLVEAYNKLQDDLAKVLSYSEENGLAREDVALSSISTEIRYKKNVSVREIDLYELTQSVEINSSNAALIDKISRESTRLIKEGVNFASDSPAYYCTKINDMKLEMLGEATRNAKARAQQILEGSGRKLGALRYASQGVFQITPEYSTKVSGYGMNDTSTIEKSIKAVISMEYFIE